MSEDNSFTKPWIIVFMIGIWIHRITHTMNVASIGPAQPYIAYNVGVDVDMIKV